MAETQYPTDQQLAGFRREIALTNPNAGYHSLVNSRLRHVENHGPDCAHLAPSADLLHGPSGLWGVTRATEYERRNGIGSHEWSSMRTAQAELHVEAVVGGAAIRMVLAAGSVRVGSHPGNYKPFGLETMRCIRSGHLWDRSAYSACPKCAPAVAS